VVGLGLCVRDDVYLVDDFADDEGRTRYRDHVRLPGGMTANAVLQAALLGCEAHLLSMVGRDADGRFVAGALRRGGVITRRLRRSDAHPTTTALVLVERGSGRRRFVVPDRRRLERSAPDFDLAPIREGAVLMIDGHFPGQLRRALPLARARGVPVIGDLSDARAAHLRWIDWIDHPILPLEFARTLGVGGPRDTLRHLAARCTGLAAISLGAKGVLALDRGRFRRIPAPRVKVVDTTGAGDALHGAFAAGLAQGRAPFASLERAVRVASDACRRLGGPASVIERTRPAGGSPG
jgi:sulfofructose kinase